MFQKIKLFGGLILIVYVLIALVLGLFAVWGNLSSEDALSAFIKVSLTCGLLFICALVIASISGGSGTDTPEKK